MFEIKIKESILRSFLRKHLFEQTEGGYTVGEEEHSTFPEEMGLDIELPEDVPVEPSDQMATQLSTQRPPVDDPSYTPDNPTQLGKAADVIAQSVPDEEVEFFYRALEDLLDQAEERASSVEDTDLDMDEEMNEQTEKPTQMGLEDIASELGYSSASGARQDLERILKRVSYTVDGVEPEDLETLKLYAANEYITTLANADLISKDDQREMRENPMEVILLNSFRFFFVSGLILPAYQKIVRNSRKRVESELNNLGIPKGAHQTIVNQVFGDTPKDIKKLQAKINKVAGVEGMSSEAANEVYGSLINRLDMLEKMAKLEGNLVVDAMESFGKAPPAKKEKILIQALQNTADFR